MKIGVLALQGAFREHKKVLEGLCGQVTEVRLPEQLAGLSGVVIPGGESTTMTKLMAAYGLDEALKDYYHAGGALWGTCAGAIAVATDIVGFPEQPRLELLDIGVARNAYGRQVASFEADIEVAGLNEPFPAVFIRAPRIIHTGADVEVLASYDGDPVMVSSGRLMATVFHPELSSDPRIHRYFLENVVPQNELDRPAEPSG